MAGAATGSSGGLFWIPKKLDSRISIDDELMGGLGRGEIAAVVSASGVGKSVFLANVATYNVNWGKDGF